MSKHRRLDDLVPADGYCSTVSKRRYATREKAEALLVLLRGAGRQGRGGKVESRVYECAWCHGWHLTSKEEER